MLEGNFAFLDGVLEVTLLDGFQPRAGDVFLVLDFNHIQGRFHQITLPNLNGLTWDTSDLYAAGALCAVPEPRGAAPRAIRSNRVFSATFASMEAYTQRT